MIILLLFLTNLFLLGYCLLTFFKEINVLKLFLYVSAIFISEYCFFSAIFLALDTFSILKSMLSLSSIQALIFFFRKDKKIAQISCKKESYIFIFLLLFLMPWIATKGETLRTGSDVGFYLSKAIDLMYTDTHNIKTVEEFGQISPGIDSSYLGILSSQYFNITNDETTLSYSYHALYVWPAVLALAGSICGIANIEVVLTFLYIGIIGNIWYIISRISRTPHSKYLALILFGFSPPIIYLAKMPFSELLFVYIFTCGLLFITDRSSKGSYLAGIMFGILEAVHFSTIMYLPIILCMLVFTGIKQKKKDYLTIALISLSLFGLFFFCNFKSSPSYSQNQISASFGDGFRWQTWYWIILTLTALGCSVLISIKMVYRGKGLHRVTDFFSIHSRIILQSLALIIILGIIYNAYVLGFTDKMINGEGSWEGRAQYSNRGIISLWHANIYSIVKGLSIIGLPYIYYCLFLKKEWSGVLALLYSAFLYSLGIYTFIRSDTPSNYYGSRYFAIFLIPIGVLLICYLVENLKALIFIAAIAIITSLPYNLLLKQEIGYKGSQPILNDSLECIESESIVLLGTSQNVIQILATSLQEINDNIVYSIESQEDVQAQFPNSSIYLISNTEQIGKGKELLHKTYNTSRDIACFDDITSIVKYPLHTKQGQETLYIYKIQ